MRTYRCKHVVEAARWFDTDDNRELFATWFDKHDAVFATRGPTVVLPEGGEADEGEWIVWSHEEFIVMDNESFGDSYALWSAP